MLNLAEVNRSMLVAIDPQPNFMKNVANRDRVIHRGLFLTRVAKILEIPILITEQNPEKMGGADPRIVETAGTLAPLIGKMSFSCCQDDIFMGHVTRHPCSQVVLWGVETHICVSQTAQQLLKQGYQVYIAADAVSARDQESHLMALDRMRHAGAVVTHTESIVYEWLRSAEHPKFKEVLELVKQANSELN